MNAAKVGKCISCELFLKNSIENKLQVTKWLMKDLSRSVSALLALFRFISVIIIIVSGKFREAYTSGDGDVPLWVNSWI